METQKSRRKHRTKQGIYKAGQTEFVDCVLNDFCVKNLCMTVFWNFFGDDVIHPQVENRKELRPYLIIKIKY